MKRFGRIVALFLLVTLLASCRPETHGELAGRQLFLPLTRLATAYLEVDLSGAVNHPGALIVSFIDFDGRRVDTRFIGLPNSNSRWGWDLGSGAAVDGRGFFSLRLEVAGLGNSPPPRLKYAFHPLGRPGPARRGLFNLQ